MSEPLQPSAPPPMTTDEAHSLAENLAAAGVQPEQIREHLKAHGFADPSQAFAPRDEAQWRFTQLKNDPAWTGKLNAGDAATNAEFARLTAAIAFGKPNDPLPPSADDYKFDLRRVEDNAVAQKLQSETAHFAADLKLPGNVASAVIDLVLNNVQRTELMSPDEKVNHGENQLAQLRSVLAKSGDPDAQMKEAQKTIKLHSGRDIDIASVARTSGAQVANELLLHAQALAYRASRTAVAR